MKTITSLAIVLALAAGSAQAKSMRCIFKVGASTVDEKCNVTFSEPRTVRMRFKRGNMIMLTMTRPKDTGFLFFSEDGADANLQTVDTLLEPRNSCWVSDVSQTTLCYLPLGPN